MKVSRFNISFLSILFFALLFVQCKNVTETQEQNLQDTTDVAKENQTPEIRKRCFTREFTHEGNPDLKDVQELVLSINGTTAAGTYNWLPAEKDQRTGSFRGTLNGNTVTATYTYIQEGQQDTETITITLGSREAEVSSENKSLGLDATMPEIPCAVE